MTFISYAQNFEDVILNRVLKDVDKGFYIDVGAQDPILDSVTRGFYDKGWRGLNVEATAAYAEKLKADRPEDITVQAAASDSEGSLTFYELPNTGLSTTSKTYALQHQAAGYPMQEETVPALTLDKICAQAGVTQAHFLKIDVEGAELSVLKGFSFDKLRPWVLVIEATEPMSTTESYAQWEPVVLAHGYVFVYKDGLNRFYLAQEHQELKERFENPPNCFDDFIRFCHLTQRDELARAKEQLEALGEDPGAKEKLVVALDELQQIKASLSWRITKPLRALGALLKEKEAKA